MVCFKKSSTIEFVYKIVKINVCQVRSPHAEDQRASTNNTRKGLRDRGYKARVHGHRPTEGAGVPSLAGRHE